MYAYILDIELNLQVVQHLYLTPSLWEWTTKV